MDAFKNFIFDDFGFTSIWGEIIILILFALFHWWWFLHIIDVTGSKIKIILYVCVHFLFFVVSISIVMTENLVIKHPWLGNEEIIRNIKLCESQSPPSANVKALIEKLRKCQQEYEHSIEKDNSKEKFFQK